MIVPPNLLTDAPPTIEMVSWTRYRMSFASSA